MNEINPSFIPPFVDTRDLPVPGWWDPLDTGRVTAVFSSYQVKTQYHDQGIQILHGRVSQSLSITRTFEPAKDAQAHPFLPMPLPATIIADENPDSTLSVEEPQPVKKRKAEKLPSAEERLKARREEKRRGRNNLKKLVIGDPEAIKKKLDRLGQEYTSESAAAVQAKTQAMLAKSRAKEVARERTRRANIRAMAAGDPEAIKRKLDRLGLEHSQKNMTAAQAEAQAIEKKRRAANAAQQRIRRADTRAVAAGDPEAIKKKLAQLKHADTPQNIAAVKAEALKFVNKEKRHLRQWQHHIMEQSAAGDEKARAILEKRKERGRQRRAEIKAQAAASTSEQLIKK